MLDGNMTVDGLICKSEYSEKTKLYHDRNMIIENACGIYKRPLSIYIYRIVKSFEDTEDIVQETFVRLCGADDIFAVRNLEAFLFTTAYRLAIDFLRRQKRAPIDRSREIEPETICDLAPHAESHYAGKQELDRLYARVATLPPQRRRTFVLRKFHDLSYREIAEEMGITVGSVRKHLSAALSDCRADLDTCR